MERTDYRYWKFQPLCLMDGHKGDGALRSAVSRVFEFGDSAILKIAEVVIEKIPYVFSK